MNLRSGKATVANPCIPRTPRCTKSGDGIVETLQGGVLNEPSKTSPSARRSTNRASSWTEPALTFGNAPDSFTTTPRATRLPGKHWQKAELMRGFDTSSLATKSNRRVRFWDEHQGPITRNHHGTNQALPLFPISPSASHDVETNGDLDRSLVPLEMIFPINFSMDATSLNDKKEIFNQYKFCKELQNCSTEKTFQISILPLKTRSVPDHSLVLGLDETLVHCQLTPMEDAEFVFPVHFQDKNYQVHVRLRPYCREFLERVSQFYEVILFTSATKDYTDKLMDILDPQRRIIKHRLYRKHCICVKGNYVRELMVLGRDLARTVFVDSSSEGFEGQNANAILIKSWFKNPRDQELHQLVPFLQKLAELDDVRPVIQRNCQPESPKQEVQMEGCL